MVAKAAKLYYHITNMVEINRLPIRDDLKNAAVYAPEDDMPVFVPDYAQGCEIFSIESIAAARYLTLGAAQSSMNHDTPPPRPSIPFNEKQIIRSELGQRAIRCADGTCPFPEKVKTCFRRSDQTPAIDPTIFE